MKQADRILGEIKENGITLTELERTVIQAICVRHYGEAYCTVTDISEETGLDKPVIKGVVGSLVKKDIIVAGWEDDGNGQGRYYAISFKDPYEL